MVFESLVVDLINRFLGDYVENLDRSQLKLGIWGGDVNLKNLDVKESALDEFDLPVKVISGHIGNLTLKIPWKNLYTSPVVAVLDSVYVVAVPNKGVKFDEEKVEKSKQELKQKELKRIEDAKLKEANKGNEEKKVDTFAEKMVTQVIKNLQVKIMKIHIRYEDAFTNPKIPFSVGITLHNLSFETTDENWRPCVLQEDAKMIHKVVLLDGLAIYLNSDCQLFCKMSPEQREVALEKAVATSKVKPQGMKYILGPINSVAQLKLNPKPELDGSNYSIPKVDLNIAMDEIALGITKSQYQRLMEMLDSMDRMARSALYMKFRPEVPLHGHAKSWWKFAMNCILEEDIRRKRRNWSWRNMQNHRQLCRTYRDVYKEKLLAKKVSKEIESQIEAMEKRLDVFNITVARRQAEIEAAFLSKKETKSTGGWFGGWFGGGKQEAKSESKGLEIAKKIEDAMTDGEKSKLYEAIGYQENAAPTEYPHEFVENKVQFNLHSLTLSVIDDTSKYPHVLKAKLNRVEAKLDQRPSAAAMKVESSFKSFTVFGCPVDENNWPVLISSQADGHSNVSLLSVVYETNPLDKSCDQRVRVLSQSLEIAYNALTINQLVEVLKPPESLSLSQLQAAAALKLDDFKEMSAYGLQFAIERHQYLDLLVDLQPSIIIVPENGVYDDIGHQLMINLGNLKMSSFARSMDDSVTVRSLVKAGSTEDEILSTMMSEAYDKFEIKIENVAILMTASGLSWLDVEKRQDALHILQPMNVNVEFQKAIVTDDPRIPKMKLKGELPSLKISISDMKTMQLMKIATSIPTPESAPALPESAASATTNALAENINAKALKQVTKAGALTDSETTTTDRENTQMTDLDLTFNINEIALEVCRASGLNEESKMLSFALYDIGTKVVMRTHDMNVALFLGGITMENLEFTNSDGTPLYILHTPLTAGSNEKLFSVNFLAVDKKAPNFSTTYESTLQCLSLTFTRLDVILHQEAILSVMAFANYLASNLASATPVQPNPKPSFMDTNALKKYPSQLILSRAKKTEKEIINMKVSATMSSIGLVICNSRRKITSAQIAGLQADVLMDNSKISVNALLKSVLVSDPTPGAVYDKILSTVSGDVMNVALVMYNDATEGLGYIDMKAVDMSVSLNVGRMKIVYLNKYIASILGFLDQFQVAKDKMAAASAAAAQVAKQGLEEAYEKATRVGLSLCLMAPVIVVPQSSKSLNALIADLGTMTLKNAFSTKEHRNELGFPSIFDTINLKIEDLKLSRVILKKEDELVNVMGECLLLEPLSFVLRIERNLTFGWCTECPEIDIKATLAAVNVSLSQEDYAMIMKTLSDNLGEAPDRPVEVHEVEEKLMVTVASDLHATPTDKKEGQDRMATTKDTSYSVKRMKFHFVMDSCGAILYMKSSNLDNKTGLVERDISQSLASVELKTMALSGEMFNDNSMWANVILVNCILDDTRACRKQGIRRLMEKTIQDDITANMVDVTYRLDAKKDTAVDVKVNNFTLIGCLEYLLILGNFFSTPPSEVPKDTVAVPTTTLEVPKTSMAKTPTSETSTQSSTMSINLSLLKPDIVLIEDIDDINSNAVIFNNEAFIKMRITPEGQNIQGTISGLELFTAKFNPKYRSSTMQQILNPCDINLTFNAFVAGDQRINVTITDVVLHVNPATVQLLTNISSALTASSAETEENKVEVKRDPPDVVWGEKDIDNSKLWYMGTSQLKAALEVTEDSFMEVAVPERGPSPVNEELMMLTINSILVTVEAGVGKSVVPLILLESKFRSEIRNWTSKLKIECYLSVEVASFNEKLAVWEPLIEPVESKTGHNPWELTLRVIKNEVDPIEPNNPIDDLDSPGSEDVVFKPPLMSVEVASTDMLLVTVTKTCLEVITNLGKAFGQAMQKDSSLKLEQSSAPYVVKNNLGIPLMLVLEGTEFQVQSTKEFSPRKSMPIVTTAECKEIQEVFLEANTTVGLSLKNLNQKLGLSSMRRQSSRMEYFFNLKIDTDQVSAVRTVYLTCTDKRYFGLPLKTYPGDQWGFIVSISSASGAKVINLHSVVQVVNHFQVPIEIFYMKRGSEETLESCGIVDPEKNFYVPCYALYTSKNELFFKPHEKDFAISSQPFVWKDLVKEPTFGLNMFCEGKEQKKKFFIQVAGEMEQVLYEHTNKKTMLSAGYKLHLSPPAVLRNLLPIPVSVAIQCINEEFTLKPGESVSLVNVEVGRHGIEIRMKNYLDLDWKCFKVINDKMADLAVWSFEAVSTEDKKTTLDLGMRTELQHNSIVMSLYCPFWMVNRTGLKLTYRSDADNFIIHPPENHAPVLFSFRAKSFFAKKKASVKIEESEWSDKFALDVVGSSGNVVTKSKDGKPYGVGVQIKLSSFGLTKLVIFTPFYILVNNTSKALQCQEVCEQSRWITVQSQDCSPFWPIEKKSLMRARYEDSTETLPFSFKEEHETLLRLKDRNYCGINVEVTVSDASIIINFTDFLEASAAKIVNHTPSVLKYGQKSVEGELNSLAPGHLVLYAWQDPCAERELLWNCGGKNNESHSLAKDGIGEVLNESGTKLYWVSFLDGMQRVLFVTDDVLLATNARSGELERVQQEIILSLDGFGLSLINNQINKEILYFCIASTGVVWEGRKHNHNRFKALSLKDNLLIENAYLSYNRDIEAKKTLRHRVILEKRLEIDFVDFTMIRPHKRVLRRSFQTGLWCSYKTSPHQMQLHAKINRLQIDNQLPDCIFPVILAPVPLSKSMAAESMPKPFVELSLVQRIPEQSTEIQYQYFRVLVQEFEVKLDLGFVNSILAFLSVEEEKSIDYEEKLALDKETAAIDLKGLAKDYFYQEQKSFFDNLHFSPLKVHLSFSMSGGVDSGSTDGHQQSSGIHSDFLNLLLQSIGVTITEVQDVVFKLNYFERNNSFMTNQQLINAAVSHYSSQAIKQFYVLLLGLDVIGNPVGLLLGIKSGIGDFFYEPIQGAIEGPEEFAEGLALGVKSLLGHTVGGAAGAVSRITGSLGKGLAALTMDKDYQRRRQQQINRRPQNAAQGMAQGGKNLVMGFVEGVTGVVTKPMTGAKEEGFGGFFKGVGKGLIGVVARPTAGAIDFASGSLDAVKKAMDTSEEVKRVRLPRFIQPDTIIRPYITFEAEGLRLLLDVEKGKFASTDTYVAHVPITDEKKTFLMVTSQRIIYIEKGDVFGQWNAPWNYTWDEVKETPVITEKGIKILLKDHKKKTGFFGHSDNGKIVCLKDVELCKFIIGKMEEAMRNTLQERRSSGSKWSSTPSSSIHSQD